ncbi:hypothetical protein QQ045_032929 [Rhodiola kirilowii]
MGKHWEAGWTTISTCSRRAREQWFKEFSMLAKWDENKTPIIKRIFNSKCHKKLIESWYNARHRRSLEGPKWLKPHEVRAGIQYYLDHPEDLEKISARNKKNSEGSDGRCVHLGGNKASHVHKARMTTALKKTIYCYDMYVRLKMKPDGTFVEEDGARKAEELLLASDALRSRFGDAIPEALDLEMASQIIGLSKRDRLPKVVRSIATSLPGSKFYSQPISLSQPSTSAADLGSQVRDMM